MCVVYSLLCTATDARRADFPLLSFLVASHLHPYSRVVVLMSCAFSFFVALNIRWIRFDSVDACPIPIPRSDLTSKEEMTAKFQQLHPAFTLVAVGKAIG